MSRSGPAALAALALAAGPALLAGDVRALAPPSPSEGLVALGACLGAVENLHEVAIGERTARLGAEWCRPGDEACNARARAAARLYFAPLWPPLNDARHDRLELLRAIEHAAVCRDAGDPACLDYVPPLLERKRATMRLDVEAVQRESEVFLANQKK